MVSSSKTIAVDVMSGDHGLDVTVPAALGVAKTHPKVTLILVGDAVLIRKSLQALGHKETPRLCIQSASQTVHMSDSVSHALRRKKDSSMRVAIDLVKKGQAHACVSAGNTGALVATARFVLKTLPGIDRPAIMAHIPSINGHVTHMLDLGANVDSDANQLYQFAVMGSVAVAAVTNTQRPRVALLNIGEEDIKGNKQVKVADQYLSGNPSINYMGYIEANNLFNDLADVVVCDGFVGNVALKTCEGTAKFLVTQLKNTFYASAYARLVGVLAKPVLRQLKDKLDTGRYNGASLLGLQGIVIKSHGHSDVHAFTHAIKVAIKEAESAVPSLIKEKVHTLLCT